MYAANFTEKYDQMPNDYNKEYGIRNTEVFWYRISEQLGKLAGTLKTLYQYHLYLERTRNLSQGNRRKKILLG